VVIINKDASRGTRKINRFQKQYWDLTPNVRINSYKKMFQEEYDVIVEPDMPVQAATAATNWVHKLFW
jgi:hypothetical protein